MSKGCAMRRGDRKALFQRDLVPSCQFEPYLRFKLAQAGSESGA
jgi:hypothetical protein